MQTVAEMGERLSPFVRQLFQGETRICMHDVGNDVFNDEKMFVVTKDIIHIPYILPAVEHEIAHAVEMTDKSRWLLPDWGMKMEPFKSDSLSFLPFMKIKRLTPRMMFAAMSREVRVRAIQLHMLPESEHNNKKSSLYNILNNIVWGDWAKEMVPFGRRFKTYQDVNAWVNDLREKTFRAWSKDRIIHEWSIRLNYYQEWMETA